MPYFAVLRQRGPRWDRGRPMREQEGWPEHAAFMDGLAEEGFVVLGGPLGDGDEFLFLVEAASEEAVKTQLAEDPWPPERLRLARVEPWEVLLGDPSRAASPSRR